MLAARKAHSKVPPLGEVRREASQVRLTTTELLEVVRRLEEADRSICCALTSTSAQTDRHASAFKTR